MRRARLVTWVRDRRLDFWRGLCLVDMVLVHLAYEGVDFGALGSVVTEYARFAAGGFVFVAGLTVAVVFLPRTTTHESRRATYAFLRRRAAYLLGVHYAATASFVALDAVRGYGGATPAWPLVRDVLLLRDTSAYADVLPLYVVMLLAAPGVLALLRRNLWPVVALVSGVLFVWGQRDPWLLSPRSGETFPAVLWQAMFVAGALFGTALPAIERSRRRLLVAAATSWAVFAVVLALHPATPNAWRIATPLVFSKVPLNAPEALRYVALTVALLLTSAVVWRRIAGTAAVAAIATLGRESLAVYVAHVWVQAPIVAMAWKLHWLGDVQAALALVALAVLWAAARTLEARREPRRRGSRRRLRLEGWAGPPVGVAAAVVLLVLVAGGTEAPEAPESGARPAIDADSEADMRDAVEPAADATEETGQNASLGQHRDDVVVWRCASPAVRPLLTIAG